MAARAFTSMELNFFTYPPSFPNLVCAPCTASTSKMSAKSADYTLIFIFFLSFFLLLHVVRFALRVMATVGYAACLFIGSRGGNAPRCGFLHQLMFSGRRPSRLWRFSSRCRGRRSPSWCRRRRRRSWGRDRLLSSRRRRHARSGCRSPSHAIVAASVAAWRLVLLDAADGLASAGHDGGCLLHLLHLAAIGVDAREEVRGAEEAEAGG